MRSRKPREDVAGSRWGRGLTEDWKRETGLFFPSLLDFHALLELQPRDVDIPGPRDLEGDILEDLIYTSARHCKTICSPMQETGSVSASPHKFFSFELPLHRTKARERLGRRHTSAVA